MKRNPERLRSALLVLALLAPALVSAQVKAPEAKAFSRSKSSLGKTPSKDELKPSGPVTITAKSAELVQGNSAVYTGDVVLTSNTLKLDGDRVELKQYAGGDYEAKITGAPAHVNHAGDGPDNPPLAARAKTLNYDSRTGILDLIGDAFAMRGTDQVSGDTIRYIVKEHRIQAAGGEGRVTVIIQPKDDATAPAGDAAAPPPAPTQAPDKAPAGTPEKAPEKAP